MKINYIQKAALFLLFSVSIYAQKPVGQLPIINVRGVSKYSNLKDLEGMNKGELKSLYLERVKILINIMPYMAITSKPGVTLKDLGVPESVENVNALKKETDNRALYLTSNAEFLDTIMSYSDKSVIITAILFLEETMKKIHSGDEL